MAKVHVENVRDLVVKAGEIREKLALGTRRIGNVHIGGPMSATDVTVALYYKYMGFVRTTWTIPTVIFLF